MGLTSYVTINDGTVLKATPINGNPNAIGIVTGTQEPFTKTFKDGITVEGSLGTDINLKSNVHISGSITYQNINRYSGGTTTIGSNLSSNQSIYLLSPTSGTVTIALPYLGGSSTNYDSQLIIIKKLTSTGTVSINPAGPTTVDGSTSMSATAQYSFIQLLQDGPSNSWIVIANNGFS